MPRHAGTDKPGRPPTLAIVAATLPRCPSEGCRSPALRYSATRRQRDDAGAVLAITRYATCQACGERFVVIAD